MNRPHVDSSIPPLNWMASRFGLVCFRLYKFREKRRNVRHAASMANWLTDNDRQASFTSMPEMFKFRVYWRYEGRVYFDEFCAASESRAAQYFNDNKRADVSLVRVVYIGPDDGGIGVQEFARSPDSPFSPLLARRRLDKDEDAR